MDPRPENRYGTAGAVECRVGHELVVQHKLGRFLKLKVVIGFQGFFRAVAQRTVAIEYAQAAGLQEFLVRVRRAAYHAHQAESIVRAIVYRAFDAHAQRRRPSHLAVGP